MSASHPQSLSAARERAVKVLGDAFAADAFEMDELEARLSRVYQAATMADLDAIIADVVPTTADRTPVPVVSGTAAAPERLGAFMASTRRAGRWAMPQRLEARAFMSDLTLDLRECELPATGCEIVLRAGMSSVLVFVRPGTAVTVDIDAFLASVEDHAQLAGRADPRRPPVRITGKAMLASIEVRAVGLPHQDDDGTPPALPTQA